MFCGRCGGVDIDPIKTVMKQDGSTVTVTAVAVCPKCCRPFGYREFFHLCDWEAISEKDAKKVLDKAE